MSFLVAASERMQREQRASDWRKEPTSTSHWWLWALWYRHCQSCRRPTARASLPSSLTVTPYSPGCLRTAWVVTPRPSWLLVIYIKRCFILKNYLGEHLFLGVICLNRSLCCITNGKKIILKIKITVHRSLYS